MGWFGRKTTNATGPAVASGKTTGPSRPVPAAPEEEAPPAVDLGALADRALDALAAALRTLGRYSFETALCDAEAFARHCERWARHVLTAAPLEPRADEAEGEERARPAGAARGARAWRELQQFLLEHRRAEQAFVEERIGELKDAIWAFIDGLRDLAGSDGEMESSLHGHLQEIERAVQGDSLEAVRALVFRAVDGIRGTLAERRSRLETRMRVMGETLRALRTDLLELRKKAELDPLTELYNRGSFDTALRRYVELGLFAGQGLCLMLVDLDRFKELNDRYGHPAGDRVLRAAAAALLRAFPRRTDLVARYGGDELAVLLYDSDPSALGRLGERAVEAIRRAAVSLDSGEELKITCSVGLAELKPGDNPDALLARADAALYRAKKEGRDRAERDGVR
jgi:diguanylate cyclase (GGDEF)-like protein